MNKKKTLVLVFAIILILAIFIRIYYVNQTRGKCLYPQGVCNDEERLCVDGARKCNFIESINYYFFK